VKALHSRARANIPAVLSLVSGHRITPGLVATDILPFGSAAETMASAGFKPVYVRDPIAGPAGRLKGPAT